MVRLYSVVVVCRMLPVMTVCVCVRMYVCVCVRVYDGQEPLG